MTGILVVMTTVARADGSDIETLFLKCIPQLLQGHCQKAIFHDIIKQLYWENPDFE